MIGKNEPKTLQSCASSCTCLGSRLSLIVPSNKAASCGMIASRLLKSNKPILETSKLSMLLQVNMGRCLREIAPGPDSLGANYKTYLMLPEVGSMIRKSARVNELLPAPVLPTTPIFSCGRRSRLMFLRTKSKPSRYLVL